MTRHTRRDLLRLACCSTAGASLVSRLSKLGLVSALAQGTTDYKALVCIFMFGGNDSNNMLVPTDSRYTQYLQARSVLALPQSQLLPLQMNGQSIYGLHPNMPEIQAYFNSQKSLAVVANVGTLVQPTTQATYRAYKNLPENLFSHSDQQDQWQSAQLAGTPVSGWAGKVADNVQTFNAAAQFPPILSISGNPVFCTGGGFDTHADQLPQQVQLLSTVSHGMSAFYQATQELGVANQVTTFSLSEFSRTLEPGSNGGSDHAWGGHQLILGGAVKGNAIYGTYPTLALGGPTDADQNGRWIPTTALDQYAATLATWFGVSAANLPSIFPNLANFPTSNLGFMG